MPPSRGTVVEFVLASMRPARATTVGERFFPNLGECRGGRDRFRIDLEMDDGRLAGRARCGERSREVDTFLYQGAVPAKRKRVGSKIGISKIGGNHATRIVALLMHTDGAIDAVVRQ